MPLRPGTSCGHWVRVATAFLCFPSPFGGGGEIRTQPCLAVEPCFFLGVSCLSQAAPHSPCVLVQMAPDYDHLTLMQKVEVFEHAVNNTAGDDLARLLWLKSPSSEVRHPTPPHPTPLVPLPFGAPPRVRNGFLVCSCAPGGRVSVMISCG